MRTAVIDSSSLINLVHLQLANELSLFFDLIYVPRTVQVEVNRKQRFRYRLQRLYKTGIFERCTTSDKWRVELIKAELHEGEAEALILAKERNAAFFIGDERRGREIAEALELKPIGTIRILARLNLESRAEETTKLVRKLRADLRFRVTDEVVARAIVMAPEPF